MATAANVAQQVVLHPSVSQTLRLWSATLGRDKVHAHDVVPLVLVLMPLPRPTVPCSISRVSWHGCSFQEGIKSKPHDGTHSRITLPWAGNVRPTPKTPCQRVSCAQQTVMRLGKPMEHLQAAMRVALTPGVPVEQITTIGRQLAYFWYLFNDTLVWVRKLSSNKTYTYAQVNPGEHCQVLQPEAQHLCSREQTCQPILAHRNTVQHHLWLAKSE